MMAGIRRHWRLLAGEANAEIVELRGTAGDQGPLVTALYAGSGVNRPFVTSLVMDDAREQSRQVVRGYLELARALRQPDASAPAAHDVVLTDLPPLWRGLTPRDAQYRLAAWMHQELVLPPAGSQWTLPRAVEREAARLARRHGYTVDFVAAEDLVLKFYRELYAPYVAARFAAGAIIVDEREFVTRARGWTLARLHRAEQWAAGMLLETSGGALKMRWFGAALPASKGVSEVLDVACVRYARANGLTRVELGHSRPSLVDGVLRYKQRLGGELRAVRYPQAVLGIAVRTGRRELFDRLNRRQLIAIRRRAVRVLQAS